MDEEHIDKILAFQDSRRLKALNFAQRLPPDIRVSMREPQRSSIDCSVDEIQTLGSSSSNDIEHIFLVKLYKFRPRLFKNSV